MFVFSTYYTYVYMFVFSTYYTYVYMFVFSIYYTYVYMFVFLHIIHSYTFIYTPGLVLMQCCIETILHLFVHPVYMFAHYICLSLL